MVLLFEMHLQKRPGAPEYEPVDYVPGYSDPAWWDYVVTKVTMHTDLDAAHDEIARRLSEAGSGEGRDDYPPKRQFATVEALGVDARLTVAAQTPEPEPSLRFPFAVPDPPSEEPANGPDDPAPEEA